MKTELDLTNWNRILDGYHVGQLLRKFRENIVNSNTLISI